MPSPTPSTLVLATRRSPLALRQAELARAFLLAIPGANWRRIELLEITTTGDQQRDWALPEHGGKGLFTREIEEALLDGRAQLAVHSAKDLPTELPKGLTLAGFLPRADPRDVLVRRESVTTPRVVATGSPRRRAQAQIWWPEASWSELRGNVETRLKKIAAGEADATFLAAAGLARLGISQFAGLIFEQMSVERMIPAAGQGAIALECREEAAAGFASGLCAATARAVFVERAVLAALGGGCQSASAVHVNESGLHVFHETHGRNTWPLPTTNVDAAKNAAVNLVCDWLAGSSK